MPSLDSLLAITLRTVTTQVGCVLYSPGAVEGGGGIGSLEEFVALAQTTLGALK